MNTGPDYFVLFLAGAALIVFIGGAIASVGSLNLKSAEDPKMVLRRCRAELWAVRKELQRIPATRRVHEIFDQIDSTERTIDETEAVLSRGRK